MPDRATVADNATTSQADSVQAAIDATLSKPLRLYTDEDFDNFESTSWLLKDVIPENSIGTLYGPSGTFKSFIALDLLAYVAHGWRWMGKRTKPVPCVYVPFEGKGGIPKRVQAWRLAMSFPNPAAPVFPFDARIITTGITFVTDPLNLREPADRKRLISTLKAANLTGCLLCIDTLAQASAGLDENSSDMSEIIAAFQEIQRELECVVLVVHHTGKDVDRGMRGWSGIRGAMDFSIECRRADTQREGVIWLDKVKDGEDGRELSAFTMRQVGVGIDDDGDWMTSLVVAPPGSVPGDYVPADKSTSGDVQQDADDEEFIWQWVYDEVNVGNYPSLRSLCGQLNEMKEKRKITQARVRDAVARLKALSTIVDAPDKSPSGNKWLRAVGEAK